MAPMHVLALVEPGRHGGAAIAHARRLAMTEPVALTVVALAPRARGPRCGTAILDYNAAVAEAASEDLARARQDLAGLRPPVRYALLAQPDDRALGRFVAANGFDLVLLPRRRRGPGASRHPEADRLAALTSTVVRVVGPENARALADTRGSGAAPAPL